MAKDKYYLYIDDSGWRYPEQELAVRDDGLDYFALGGILVKGRADRNLIIDRHKSFCKTWNIEYPLHASEIRGKRENFAWLKDEAVNIKFNTELRTFLVNLPVIGFAVVIDRVGYNNRYKERYSGKPWWMCKTAFSILIERVSKHVQQDRRHFKIIYESCGPREDRAIVEYFCSLRKEGVPFDLESSSKYGKSKPELFKQVPYGNPERQTKKSPLLQIADLYLFPMVKGGYDNKYPSYVFLLENGKLINSILPPEKLVTHGIKYSCFQDK